MENINDNEQPELKAFCKSISWMQNKTRLNVYCYTSKAVQHNKFDISTQSLMILFYSSCGITLTPIFRMFYCSLCLGSKGQLKNGKYLRHEKQFMSMKQHIEFEALI
ncbi:hypothetical protein KUTeg_015584 [Tegillarca granosa]|uniref:Uncharacterized protein n=1 Tax=Tegillarca granosa TaxID=220873 RepID=A0ABQ9EVR6_TEGGR|nr:hypothetical protein KUTeg_015584 [Tegillarca granosa]